MDVNCPFENCKQPPEEYKLKGILPNIAFEKYKQFRRNALIERNPNNRWCSAISCQQVLRGSKQNPKLVCVCGRATCLLCGNPWHEKKTCEQVLNDLV